MIQIMPNIRKWIFNRKNLQQQVGKIDKSNIPNIQEKLLVANKWAGLAITGEIKSRKEMEMQGIFLFDIFGKILGYKDFAGWPKLWNLNQEQTTDAGKSADGSLGFFSEDSNDIRAVIELKDANTILDEKQHRFNDNRTPVEQAFSYAPQSGKKCKWVIVSNFIELRLYHHLSSSEYEVFNIAELDKWENFARFWLLLSCDNLIAQAGNSFIDTLYDKNEADEQQVSKELYSTYKKIRVKLFEHLKQYNLGRPELMLLEKTQKLLDRFIFVCFCEDNRLLPEKVFRSIIESARKSFSRSDTKIWRELKDLFEAINLGSPAHNINKFNGGLFEADNILDSLDIRDDILEEMALLSDYDYESDVDVNILGHIFEQSISDIEELKAGIENKDFDKSKSKRKKEGIYYTPEYITRYIVENAVGGWLDDRKKELGVGELPELNDEDWEIIRRRLNKPNTKISDNVRRHLEFWLAYREKLRNIKVLDPACGSGAFLNQAFNFLYAEGQKVNDKIAELSGGQHEIFQLDKHILSNNLYGVDLNRESVEITKLSLWIKTANKYSELTALDNNIKCGNSLIDDPAVAGDKAFNWFREFPEVFPGYRDYSEKRYIVPGYEVKTIEEIRQRRLQEPVAEYMGVLPDAEPMVISEPSYSYKSGSKGFEKHGFDVIIGNPPYGALLSKSEQEYYKYKFNVGSTDTAILFIKNSIMLLKKRGLLGFIIPKAFVFASNYKKIRDITIENLVILADCRKVWSEVLLEQVVVIFKMEVTSTYESESLLSSKFESFGKFNKSLLVKFGLLLNGVNKDEMFIAERILKDSMTLNDIALNQRGEMLQSFIEINNLKNPIIVNADYYNIIGGAEINRFSVKRYKGVIKKDNVRTEKAFINTNSLLVQNIIAHIDNPVGHIQITACLPFDTKDILLDTINQLTCKENYSNKYLWCILNSKLINWYTYRFIFGKAIRTMHFDNSVTNRIPVKLIPPESQQPFIEKAGIMLEKNKELQEVKNKFTGLLKNDFNLEKLTPKLQNWTELTWASFTQELKKLKIDLRGEAKEDWYDRFNRLGAKAREIKQVIDTTDKEIDKLVYELYGLTNEEIRIVEGEG